MEQWEILVVEDDVHGQRVVGTLLQHYGIQVDIVGNAEQALERLSNHTYKAVIIDLSLPGMSGWELLDKLRATPAIANIPCFAITAYHSSSVVQRAIEAGFLGYFAKPIDVAHFVQDLEAHVTQQMLEAYVSNSIHGFQQGAEAPC